MINTIVEGLFEYFKDCPLMVGSRLNIDYLPEDTKKAGIEYAIATEPNDQLITRYRGGAERCRYSFVISSVNDYGQDVLNQIANTGYMEKLGEWMRKQNKLKKFPELPHGMTARSMEAKGVGYLFEPNATSGKYQIMCELQYYKK